MTYRTIGHHSARAGRAGARVGGRALVRGLRGLADGATPDVPVPPPGRAVDLPGRGTTHVLDLAGPTPDAPILLLMHGIATTGPLTWFSVLEDLRQRYRVVTFDQRWHGRGIRSENFTLDDCADDAVAVLDALGIERAVVVGYSMGGASAQVLWHRHPERVAGLVLCSTSARWQGHLGERVFFLMLRVANYGLLSVAADKVQAHADTLPPLAEDAPEAGLRAWCMAELRATSLWSLPVVMAELGRFDATSWIGGVAVPTGILVTARDHAIPTERQWQLAGRIPGAITRVAPGGHASLVFDLARWKPVFLELVDAVMERASEDAVSR
ncbi:alpha/beta fold hydrolase [Nocardioides bizhenqiangii]|uniref:Alpha/beta hydrolase n=1 Tax=Nocardioides bizhenqiangii TaxID=3095076 RepID=A0ABZ0ZPI5_9ACTN|nr:MULTISPECIES: alpha/beta hydrolase [unclassified Nocardioides]MDZ5619776.1 alpha/beta hydrolase [Nocardioides sp. HM23]WQQ26217.1 alpha/beta hydrolase [Nocardioides sp. HM61]